LRWSHLLKRYSPIASIPAIKNIESIGGMFSIRRRNSYRRYHVTVRRIASATRPFHGVQVHSLPALLTAHTGSAQRLPVQADQAHCAITRSPARSARRRVSMSAEYYESMQRRHTGCLDGSPVFASLKPSSGQLPGVNSTGGTWTCTRRRWVQIAVYEDRL